MAGFDMLNVLFVEDNEGDVRLVAEAVAEGSLPVELRAAPNAAAARAILEGACDRRGAWAPHIILLDLNLPGPSGRDFLAEVKSDPKLQGIPVIVFTSSHAADDIRVAYERHANSYVQKPREFARLLDVLRAIVNFWLHAAVLPCHG